MTTLKHNALECQVFEDFSLFHYKTFQPLCISNTLDQNFVGQQERKNSLHINNKINRKFIYSALARILKKGCCILAYTMKKHEIVFCPILQIVTLIL